MLKPSSARVDKMGTRFRISVLFEEIDQSILYHSEENAF